MARIDVADGFDVHDYRHALKLLREERTETVLANREGLGCPACGDPFDRLLVTSDRTRSIPDRDGRLCVARTDDQLLVLSH